MPRRKGRPNRKKKNKLTQKQQRFVKELAKGATLTAAAKNAGYSPKNADQSGYQALNQLRGRIPDLLERHGLGEETVIEKYLVPLLDAHETKFFNDGNKRINVQALGIRLAALRTVFELHGSYAPRDPKEAAQYGVKIIKIDIPRPANAFNEFVDVIPETALSRHGVKPVNGANGTPPKNGKPPTNGDAT